MSGVPRKVSEVTQNLRTLNKHNMSLKAIFPDPIGLISSDSRSPENQDMQPSTKNKVFKIQKKQAFIECEQTSQSVTAQRLQQLKQRSTERSNSSISGITMKSSWL